jgi:hypothetical protein
LGSSLKLKHLLQGALAELGGVLADARHILHAKQRLVDKPSAELLSPVDAPELLSSGG